MREPVLVQTWNPVDVKQEEVDDLLRRLRFEGLEARRAEYRGEGFGIDDMVAFVTIWIAVEASKAVINQVVRLAVEWAKERFFQQHSESGQPQKALRIAIVRYEGEKGKADEIIELEAEDADPVRRSPEESERAPRRRPE